MWDSKFFIESFAFAVLGALLLVVWMARRINFSKKKSYARALVFRLNRTTKREAGTGSPRGWPATAAGKAVDFAFYGELESGYAAMVRNELPAAYAHFERAHVLGQNRTGQHLRSHVAFLRWSIAARDMREAVGQLARIVGAAVLTWLWVPRGNTGGARVSALRPMPIAPDLQALLERVKLEGLRKR